ncbi:MAG: leucine-rich repeat domain-containing protein [Pseudomonadota bacterium]
MKHHWGDWLDRSGGHWTFTPNAERYAYLLDDLADLSRNVTILTISKSTSNWERIFELACLTELTLHEPNREQLHAVSKLRSLSRLRISHARPRNLDFLTCLENLSEIVLEYVSGVGDLAPLGEIRALRALHLENLRGIRDFSGLSFANNLRYLSITGTLDWDQPIASLDFLEPMKDLEFFLLGSVKVEAQYPATLPLARLTGLKKVKLVRNKLPVEEFALVEVGLDGVEGAHFEPCQRFPYGYVALSGDDIRSRVPVSELSKRFPEVVVRYDGSREIPDPNNDWYVRLGKGAGRIKSTDPKVEEKCSAYAEHYNALKTSARELLKTVET